MIAGRCLDFGHDEAAARGKLLTVLHKMDLGGFRYCGLSSASPKSDQAEQATAE